MNYTIEHKTNNSYKEIILLNKNNTINSIINNIIYIKNSKENDTLLLSFKNQLYYLIFEDNYLCKNLLKYYYLSLNSSYFTTKTNRPNIQHGHSLVESHNIANIEITFNTNHKYYFNKIQKISTITKSPILLSNVYMCVSDKNFLTLFLIDNKLIASFSLCDYDLNYINFYGYSLIKTRKNIKFNLSSQEMFLHKKSKLDNRDLCSIINININGSI